MGGPGADVERQRPSSSSARCTARPNAPAVGHGRGNRQQRRPAPPTTSVRSTDSGSTTPARCTWWSGKYDFSTKEVKGKVYFRTDSVPDTEPGTWDVNTTAAAGAINAVNGIQFVAGAASGYGAIGDVYFDEIRVATNWTDWCHTTATAVDPSAASGDGGRQGDGPAGLDEARRSHDVMIVYKHQRDPTARPTDELQRGRHDRGRTARGHLQGQRHEAGARGEPGPDASLHVRLVQRHYYSTPGLTANVTMGSYASYEIVNPFSYTNGTALGTTTGGRQRVRGQLLGRRAAAGRGGRRRTTPAADAATCRAL